MNMNSNTGQKRSRRRSTPAGEHANQAEAVQGVPETHREPQDPEQYAREEPQKAATGALEPGKSGFLVVGVGASAGGVAALEQFFDGVPGERPGMAFVVVTHLSPDHKSELPAILQNHTRLRVTQVTKAVKVRPNTVYVIPPGKNLSMSDGSIRLSDLDEVRGRRAPIDLFFRTLAQSHGGAAAAVVLSGSGSDGAVGLPRVKERGGITLSQDPNEAEHNSMPKSAIATGFVDYILPARAMGERLLDYNRNHHTTVLQVPAEEVEESAESRQSGLESTQGTQGTQDTKGATADYLYDITGLLHARTGHNFASYKRATLTRRIERRMQVNGQIDLPGYLDFLRTHPAELQLLMRDLLISVTNFYRDEEVWTSLANDVMPVLFKDKDRPDSVVRAWVAGCATGEEAYSLAISLLDFASGLTHPPRVQVFATDLDDHAIAVAREGSYPETVAVDVPPEYLKRYFTHSGRRYRVAKDVRESVLFAAHDLLKDPPFSKLDLITCRNLLIYLNSDAQEQVLGLFHFALRPEGYLLLGTSESVDGVSQLFTPWDKKHHIFKRRSVQRGIQPTAPLKLEPGPVTAARSAHLPSSPLPGALDPQERPVTPLDLHQDLLERYAPPSVLVDEDYHIVHMSDNAVRYLQLRGGEPTNELLRLVHPGLRLDLHRTLYNAAGRGIAGQTRRVPLYLDGPGSAAKYVRALVRPAADPQGYVLVMFDELDAVAVGEGTVATEASGVSEGAAVAGERGSDGSSDKHAHDLFARQLEEEVQVLRGQLRMTVEQHETSIEEVKASNEELQAMNEELRSTSEELETSKEEIQATNEELLTVNDELKIKVAEVSHANSDLRNFIVSSDIATIFLNRRMQVKRYTPRAEKIFNIIPTDLDRPIGHLTHRLHYDTLIEDAQSVLNDLRPVEREVQTTDGAWYIVRLLPYRTLEDRIDGVVLTFTDITERKRGEEALHKSEERFRAVANVATDLLWRSEPDGSTDWYNNRWTEYTGQTLEKALGWGWLDTIHPDDREDSAKLYREAVNGGTSLEREHRIQRHDGEYRWFLVRAEPLLDENGRLTRMYGDATDIQEQRVAREELEERVRKRTAELAQANEALRRLSARILEVQEEERRHIARELHDEIGQYLTGLRLMLEKPQRESRSKGRDIKDSVGNAEKPQSDGQLAPALDVLRDLTQRVRDLALDLRPTMLDDIGLLPALLWHVERFAAQTGVEVDFQHRGLKERLPADIETTVYRVVQEALTNVARHSGAKHVTVQLMADGQVTAVIEDAGNGFDVEETSAQHTSTGLSAMRERVELVGGKFTIDSSAGHGTLVIVDIPNPHGASE